MHIITRFMNTKYLSLVLFKYYLEQIFELALQISRYFRDSLDENIQIFSGVDPPNYDY